MHTAAGDKRGTRSLNQFTIRNGYGFINRNDNKDDVCTQQIHIKKKSKKNLLEVDSSVILLKKRVGKKQTVIGLVELQFKTGSTIIDDDIHLTGVLHAITKTVRKEGSESQHLWPHPR